MANVKVVEMMSHELLKEIIGVGEQRLLRRNNAN